MLNRRRNKDPEMKITEAMDYHFRQSGFVCEKNIQACATELAERLAYNDCLTKNPGHDSAWYYKHAKEKAGDFMDIALQTARAKGAEMKVAREKQLEEKTAMLADEVGCDAYLARYLLQQVTGDGDKGYNYAAAKLMYYRPGEWSLSYSSRASN